jgi:hypothetical protein
LERKSPAAFSLITDSPQGHIQRPGTKGKIAFDWIQGISQRVPQKKRNISASDQLEPALVSRTYYFINHDMPAFVFELGVVTPVDF